MNLKKKGFTENVLKWKCSDLLNNVNPTTHGGGGHKDPGLFQCAIAFYIILKEFSVDLLKDSSCLNVV